MKSSGAISAANLALHGAGRRLGRARIGPGALGAVKEEERSVLERTLERTGGKVYGEDGAAALLGVPPTTLQSKIKRLGLR